MSGLQRQQSDRERLQSWADNVTSALEMPPDPVHIPLPRSSTATNSSRPAQSSYDSEAVQQGAQPCVPASLRDSLAGSMAQTMSLPRGTASGEPPAGAIVSCMEWQPTTTPASLCSLDQLQHTRPLAEFEVPLPESRSTSVVTRRSTVSGSLASSDQTINDSSFLQLQHAGSPAELRVPLPESLTTVASEDRNYWTSIGPLLGCLPHLQAMGESKGRYRNKGSVRCIDYMRNGPQPRTHRKLRPGNNFAESVRDLKHVTDPKVTTRFILVEDLSPEIIECIGSVFEVDPELFAEHLHRSGYMSMDYDDHLPAHRLHKVHVSLKWYRPIMQNPEVTQWLKAPRALLDMKETMEEKGKAKEMAPGFKEWFDPAYNADGTWNEDASHHRASIGTNIFRRSWCLSARPGSRDEASNASSSWGARFSRGGPPKRASSANSTFDRGWKHDAVPTAWEEKASFFRYIHGSVPIILLLLDPLPSISDLQIHLASQRKHRRSGSRVLVDAVKMPLEMSFRMFPRLPFHFPANKFDASLQDIQSLIEATDLPVSTVKALQAQSDLMTDWNAFQADPILGLLRVVQHDSRAFFKSLEGALDEISADSLDGFLMSRRLEDWRKLISDFEMEVPAIGTSLHEFTNFVFDGGTLPRDIKLVVDAVDAEIERIKVRLVDAHAALRADMQFSESRRSIHEAKSVTRITELAFVFIPLSFTASLFSMSIRELEAGVPAWTFVVTSLGMALLAYTVRLALTSDFLAESSRLALERFWNSRGAQRGTNAPILTISKLTLQEIWQNGGSQLLGRASLVLFSGSILMVPVVFIWTSTALDIGFNSALTIFFLLSTLVLAVVIYFIPYKESGVAAARAHGRRERDDESVDV